MKALAVPTRSPAVAVLEAQAIAASKTAQRDAAMGQLALATGETALLVAVLAHSFPSVWSYSNPLLPTTPYVLVFTSVGQLAWPVREQDMVLFAHVPYRQGANWIQRSCEERVRMLRALAERLSEDSSMLDAMQDAR